jgi:hypothetical protein
MYANGQSDKRAFTTPAYVFDTTPFGIRRGGEKVVNVVQSSPELDAQSDSVLKT